MLIVILGDALMSIRFLVMVLTSLYRMWIWQIPDPLRGRAGDLH
ncbi:MAG: hypothetical protein V3T64_00370 [Myxococcota bacterium]